MTFGRGEALDELLLQSEHLTLLVGLGVIETEEVQQPVGGEEDQLVHEGVPRGLRLGRWKVTRYSTGETELYDLREDPLELDNLARVPRYAGVRTEMLALLRQYRDCAGAACRRPVPPAYRLDVGQEKALTDAETRRTNAYFGN